MKLLATLAFLLCFICAGCAPADTAKLPQKLTPLAQKVVVKSRWRQRVGVGAGKLYRLIPPVVEGDVVYANDYQGRVFAIERESGDQLWSTHLSMAVSSGVGVGRSFVFLASLNGDIVALDKATGVEQWRVNVTGEVLAAPQSNGATVVVQTNDGKLLGLDASNGAFLWRYTAKLPILTLRGTSTPQVLGTNIVAGFANGKLIALSAVDGSLYWERRIARPSGRSDIERVVDIDGSPVIAGQRIYTTSYNGTLSALSPRGQLVWSQSVASYSSPVVIGERVFVTTSEGSVKAFDAATGLLLWDNPSLARRKLSAPQNVAGFLVVADYQGYVHVFDSDTGMVIDRFQVDRDGVRSPMVSDGQYLYVLGNDGVLASLAIYLLKPSS